jgi:hypothetical protein
MVFPPKCQQRCDPKIGNVYYVQYMLMSEQRIR